MQKWIGLYKWRTTDREGSDGRLGKYSKPSMEEILKPKDEAFPWNVLALITASIYSVGSSVTLSHCLSPVLIVPLGKLRLGEAIGASQWKQ